MGAPWWRGARVVLVICRAVLHLPRALMAAAGDLVVQYDDKGVVTTRTIPRTRSAPTLTTRCCTGEST